MRQTSGPAPADHSGHPAGPGHPTDGAQPTDEIQTTDGAEPTDAAQPALPVPGRAGLRQLVGDDFSLTASIGGVRGLLESVAPGLVFVVVFIISEELVAPLIASLGVALVLVVLRLLGGTPVTQALGGVLGVAIGVLWAWRSGQSQNFFALGLWTNAAYALALLVSVAVRWPLVGVVVALLRQEGFGWRTDPGRRVLRRRYDWATWLWIALFGARLAVQIPLYLDAATAWLGTARLVMGVPLWALALWLTWLLVRDPAGAAAQPDHSES